MFKTCKSILLVCCALSLAACGGGGGGGTSPSVNALTPPPPPVIVSGASSGEHGEALTTKATNMPSATVETLDTAPGASDAPTIGGTNVAVITGGSFLIYDAESKTLITEIGNENINRLENGYFTANVEFPGEVITELTELPASDGDGEKITFYLGNDQFEGYLAYGVQTLAVAGQNVTAADPAHDITLAYSTFGAWSMAFAGRGTNLDPEAALQNIDASEVTDLRPIYGGDSAYRAEPEARTYSGPAIGMATTFPLADMEGDWYKEQRLEGTASITVADPSELSGITLDFPEFYKFVVSGEILPSRERGAFYINTDERPEIRVQALDNGHDPAGISLNTDNLDGSYLSVDFYGDTPNTASEGVGDFHFNGVTADNPNVSVYVTGSFGVNGR